MTALVTCPHCALVAKLLEDDCPHCGKALRGGEGRIALTAAAALLGLTMSACGEPRAEPAPAYGVAPDLEEPEPPPPTPDPGAVPTATPTATPSASSTTKPIQPPAAAYGVPPVSDPVTPPKPRP